MDQPTPNISTETRQKALDQKRQSSAAMSSGKRQYPIRLRLWKNIILPPRRMMLSVSTRAPAVRRQNTTENICEGALDPIASRDASKRTKKKGPHKSQSRKLAVLSVEYRGINTSLTLSATLRTSRINVTYTSSSRVEPQFIFPRPDMKSETPT